jgi:hypothetical protein
MRRPAAAGPSPSQNATSATTADFSCGICFDTASEPVVTKCGHLYCWSCLDTWLQRGEAECPMCKGHISSDHPGDIIPLYGKGGTHGAPSHNSAHPLPHVAPPTAPAASATEAREHARPAANREMPPARENRMEFHWGARGGWGGGLFFLFASPSMIQWPVMLLIIILALLYKFAPWRAWLGFEPARNDIGANDGAHPPAQRDGADVTHIAMLIALFSIFIWIAGM